MPIKKKEADAKVTKPRAAKKTTAKSVKAPKAAKGEAVPKKRVFRATDTSAGSGRSLVIVESPAKAKTLHKYLGKDFKIEASIGHVMDLPMSKLGVDLENDFEPQYVVLKGKEKVIEKIKKSAESADRIFLAPDPDREGEAIAWHIATELKAHGVNKPMHRATFNEITKRAVQEAIDHPRELNLPLFEAQQARRILDRLVGYKISPILWTKVRRGLSAGRVQSVAVRMVVEREREIEAFNAEEYWSIEADVASKNPPQFEMRLTQVDNKKPVLANDGEVRAILEDLGAESIEESSTHEEAAEGARVAQQDRKLLRGKIAKPWKVSSVERKDVRRRPEPPFITSTLQQEASRKLGFASKKTMMLAQRLYEGVELGAEGMTALITYMRTDSTRISDDAIAATRQYIAQTFGAEFVPDSPNVFKTKKSAQDAHEAVRPTDMQYAPDNVAAYLDNDQLRLYTLIWNRFTACQMADAIFEQTKVESVPKDGYVFTATGLVQKFAGYLAVYEEGQDDVTSSNGKSDKLPSINEGDALKVEGIKGSQHFTQPPPRYSEATLVKELEKRGIGRPSTYATIVSVITEKEYVEKDESRRFHPTELGFIVTDLLIESFPEVLDISFTAQMEEKLDEVEEGSQNWKALLHDFYGGFKERLATAEKQMKSLKAEETPTEILCDKCGEANMVVKWGRNGRFLACPRYPECKNAKEYSSKNGGEVVPVEVIESDEVCDNCGRKMIVKSGRHGRFLACPGYPDCKCVKPYKVGVKCPACGTGDIVERQSKRGKAFFACSNYPECKNCLWNRPVAKPCPSCGSPFLLLKQSAKRSVYTCPNEKCKYSEAVPDESSAVGVAAGDTSE